MPMILTLCATIILTTACLLPAISSPLLFGALIMISTLIGATLLAFTYTSWYAYILFLVFIGGLLVMFAYVSALTPNTLLKLPVKILTTALFPALLLATIINSSPSPIIKLIPHYDSSLIKNTSTHLYFISSYPLFIVLILTLLLILAIVVKICIFGNGPLRPFECLFSIL